MTAALDVLHLELPLRLRSAANARDAHWRARHKITKAERLTTLCIWIQAKGRKLAADEKAVVLITRVAPSPLDDDNLRPAAKAVRDQLADCLGLSNDRDPRVRWDYEQARGKVREYRVDVRVVFFQDQAAPRGEA